MWNPFRKKQMPDYQEMFNKAVANSLQTKEGQEERPYRNTRIGFGSQLACDIKRDTGV